MVAPPSEYNLRYKCNILWFVKRIMKTFVNVIIYWLSNILDGGAVYGMKFEAYIHWISNNVGGST